ncbi:hypothetical protein EBU95_19930 [bacterium]|nr:hypothetical protein [bacterium]
MKKKQPKHKQKIDVVLEKLSNLELQVKELVKTIQYLQYFQPYNTKDHEPKPKYWPVDYPKYKDVTWDAIDKGLQ